MLQPGMTFPDFSLPDQNGMLRNLAGLAGRWAAVYFYPRDNTSGCSLEARNFAALFSVFGEHEAAVLGISADSVKSHCNFAAKLSLPFFLLSDAEHTLLQAAGVWSRKKMAGREYMGIVRTTFLLDPAGIVREVWPKVKIPGHAEAVLARLRELRAKA
ncbi:MAG: peroxiredoxin [Desulfovibrio sp.]|jgi:peroxiredoxin Q/BCP|nr:peroxiredoxin [Desulfovibrio sp.]